MLLKRSSSWIFIASLSLALVTQQSYAQTPEESELMMSCASDIPEEQNTPRLLQELITQNERTLLGLRISQDQLEASIKFEGLVTFYINNALEKNNIEEPLPPPELGMCSTPHGLREESHLQKKLVPFDAYERALSEHRNREFAIARKMPSDFLKQQGLMVANQRHLIKLVHLYNLKMTLLDTAVLQFESACRLAILSRGN